MISRPKKKRRPPPSSLPRSVASLFLCALFLHCQPRETSSTTDDTGRPIALAETPARIITLAPNLTEMVIAAGAESRIVGTDDFSDSTAAVKTLPKVGDMQPNVELVAGLHPDLVLAVNTAGTAGLARSLENLKIPLYVARIERLADVPRTIRRIGELLETESTAEKFARDLESALGAQRRQRNRTPRVLVAVWLDPLFVAGRESFVDDLLSLTGAVNAVDASGWPQYSLEALVTNPPDLIVIANKARSRSELQDFFRTTAPWSELEAVRSGFWYVVDENRFSRPGPRIVEAAAELNQVIDQWEQRQ